MAQCLQNILFLKRTIVRFPAPSFSGSKLSVTSAPGDLPPSFDPMSTLLMSIYTQATYMHIHNSNRNVF